jgi:hypothetical protein
MQLSAMIKVLQEYVGHHINEEQRKLFPKVKRSELDLEAIGRELMARKQELEAELAAAMTDDDGSGESMTTDDEDEEEESGSGRKRGGMAAREE